MSRRERILRKRYIVFCEGDTEFNYINAMRLNQGVELSIKPINMHGGGYKNFLDTVKAEAKNNCLAKFIIIDYDRVTKHFGEKASLVRLIEYCILQNKIGTIPHFLIINNPDFEYLACLHIKKYHGQDSKVFIEKDLGFECIDNLKNKGDIYDFLNSQGNSFGILLARLKDCNKIIINRYITSKKYFEINIKESIVDLENSCIRSSNINELFEILNW